ncbi:hypothetical protein RRG08_051869 [Elysia crispata]|uniref:Uncharacterized protein n=1 Tax=Elysia crispata TaxID=231223 RepID=A0AAE0ZAA4_9GAST|nr:hypothetical protein RRG08_051869 [Elysia crispata]
MTVNSLRLDEIRMYINSSADASRSARFPGWQKVEVGDGGREQEHRLGAMAENNGMRRLAQVGSRKWKIVFEGFGIFVCMRQNLNLSTFVVKTRRVA